jgi:trehalose synthase
MEQVSVSSLPPERFRQLLGDRYHEVEEAIDSAQRIFAGRAVWHVNSTARGGGVVELLQSLLAYARGAGVDTRWAVIEGDPDFFRVTKRIHNHLHGWPGDGGVLGEAERQIYESTLADSAAELASIVRPGDIVFLHDPQTAGLVAPTIDAGAVVVWRCHVGLDLPNELARRAWDFLHPYVEGAHAYVFSRREFVWEGLPRERTWIVAPSIDAFSPKNQELSPSTVDSILATVGLAEGDGEAPTFVCEDGTPGRVDHPAELYQEGPLPPTAPVLTQVSRWDRLKDPVGVLRAFAQQMADGDAHLLLAGPAVEAVSDDPEGAEVLVEVQREREGLPDRARERVHLACLPMVDVEENAAIVNAVQRRSQVVAQKSVAEGFGLTVAEAMWKSRAVVATRLGGIQDQIVDGESGVLIDDPEDLVEFARACGELLGDPALAERIGGAARERVRDRFLGTRSLIQYLELLQGLLAG